MRGPEPLATGTRVRVHGRADCIGQSRLWRLEIDEATCARHWKGDARFADGGTKRFDCAWDPATDALQVTFP